MGAYKTKIVLFDAYNCKYMTETHSAYDEDSAIESVGQTLPKFNTKFDSEQFKNEFNPTHWHEGHISGAGFLKVPKNLGEFSQSKPSNTYQGGNLNLVHGQRAFLSKSTYHIFPKIGDLYIFPNYLMHHVYPFKNSDEERRSISFNVRIDEKVYNVYER